MNYIEIQAVYKTPSQPNPAQIQTWVDAVLQDYRRDTEIVLRLVNEQESAQLNRRYRQKKGPTNILSFPAEIPADVLMERDLLGDLVICAPVVEKEAISQKKHLSDHWAHIVIHGVLHLLGYDHINDEDASEMELMEISILEKFNIENPYLQADEA